MSHRLPVKPGVMACDKEREMKQQVPILKELVAYFVGGLAGGFVYGILSTHLISTSFLYALIGAICCTLARVSIFNIQKKLLKSLAFGLVLGISVSCLSYYILNPSNSFFHYTIPITVGFIFGGSLYMYLISLRLQH